MDGREHARRAERLELLLEEIAALPDPGARERMEELVGMLLDLYGDAMARIVELAERAEAEHGSEGLVQALADDDLVAPLLLLHGLHPVPLEARVARALDEVRPYLRSHGGNVELLDIAEGVARLRLQGSCHGCPSSAMTLKLAIEDAIYKAAPDLDRLEVEGVADPPSQLITLAPARRSAGGARATEQQAVMWSVVEGLVPLAAGTLRRAVVQGAALVFCRPAESYYAYHDRCGGCGAALSGGTLDGTTLTCPSCGGRFDVAGAGRCPDEPDLHLEPVPLLVEAGAVKVALPATAEAPKATPAAAR